MSESTTQYKRNIPWGELNVQFCIATQSNLYLATNVPLCWATDCQPHHNHYLPL